MTFLRAALFPDNRFRPERFRIEITAPVYVFAGLARFARRTPPTRCGATASACWPTVSKEECWPSTACCPVPVYRHDPFRSHPPHHHHHHHPNSSVSQVCEGDKVVIDVLNHMHGLELVIHWHGLHQRGSQYYDGVPYVTQCPIQEGNTFRYQFDTNSGTHFWHAHSGKYTFSFGVGRGRRTNSARFSLIV